MSFAHSKIQPPQPRRGLLLARPALERRLLDALQEHRAVLVCAPAGYGKTALLVRTLAQLPPGHGAAWVSLDPGDDLHRLLECLLTALEAFDPPWRLAPEAIITTALQGEMRDRQRAVDALVNALDGCELAHGVIVLDDVHHLDDEASAHFLERLLERLGRRWTLVLASRHEPVFSLARVFAAGELTELRQADLQLSAGEVRALCADAGIDAATADALHTRTGGWAAGLRLALNGARGGSPGSLIDRQTFEFLATEVLARIHPDLRAFLLDTSVLHELDEANCSALTGDSRAAAWLDDIERLGLFASVVDEARHTLRLHDLFREALQHRLRIERGGAVWLERLARAAAIEPDPMRRISLWLQAQRHDTAAAELPGIGWQLLFQGGVATLLRLCEQFPAAMAVSSAEVQQVLGLARWHVWETRAAERHFARAASLFAQRGDAAGERNARAFRAITLLSQGRLRSAAMLVGGGTAGVDEARSGGGDVGDKGSGSDGGSGGGSDGGGHFGSEGADPDLPPGEARLPALLAETWFALESGAFDGVAPRFAALLDLLEAANRLEYWWLVIPSPRIAACRGMGPLLGRWAAGVRAATGEQPLPLHALALLALGWQALWEGHIEEAATQLQHADASASWTGQHVIVRSHSLALRALVHALRGQAGEALALARERVEALPAGYGDWGLWQMLFFACKIAALCGDIEALRRWLVRLDALGPALAEIMPEQLHPVLGLHATLAGHDGRDEEAESLWRQVLARGERADLFGQADEARVRLALLRLRHGAPDEAAQWLRPLLAPPGPAASQALSAPAPAPAPTVAASTLPALVASLAPSLVPSSVPPPAPFPAPFPAPRGAVFAAAALRELAAADWSGRLDAGAVDLLRRWAATLAAAAARQDLSALAPAPTPTAEAAGAGLGPLSPREAEVLMLVARGQSNKLIARALDLSPHTVKRHVANLLDKLALDSRSQAAAWWHAQGRASAMQPTRARPG